METLRRQDSRNRSRKKASITERFRRWKASKLMINLKPKWDSKPLPWIDYAMVWIILNSLGFPGSYTRVFGGLKYLVEYSSFLMQIAIMLTTSSDKFMDLKIVNVKSKYLPIYFFILEIGITSMITTSDRKEQIVSCIRVAETALFAIWIAEHYSIKDMLGRIHYAQILYVIASVAFPIFFKAYDRRSISYMNTFVGIGSVKNVVATEMSFGIITHVLLWIYRVKNKEQCSEFFKGFLVVQFIILLLTKCTGGLFMTGITLIFIFYVVRNGRPSFNPAIVYVIGSIGFVIVALTVMPIFTPIFDMLGKDATLTGRIPLWRQIIDVIIKSKTLFGYGYGMFWRDPKAIELVHAGFDEYSFMGQMTSGSHNNIVELLANTGICGIGSLYLSILGAYRNIRNISIERYLFSSSYLIFYLIYGWTERIWTTYEYGMLFLYVAMAMVLVEEKERRKKAVCVKVQQPSQLTEEIGAL